MGDLIPENIDVIVGLLNYSLWDYDLVGQALLPPVKSSELKRWIKENVVEYPIKMTEVDEIPEHLCKRGRGGGKGKWEWLRAHIVNVMGPRALARGVSKYHGRFPNKREMQNAQSTCSAVAFHRRGTRNIRTSFNSAAYTITTYSEAVGGNVNGAYDLYIKVTFKQKMTTTVR